MRAAQLIRNVDRAIRSRQRDRGLTVDATYPQVRLGELNVVVAPRANMLVKDHELPEDAREVRLVDLTEPVLSPDGNTLVYVATSANPAEDKSQSDLWRVHQDGTHRMRLTDTPKHDDSRPQWSPDGTSIAFLSDRGGEDAKTQVWLMPATGGKARRLTNFAEDIEDFVWSPDGKRLAFLARDPERPAGAPKPKQPPPIVTERY